MAEKFGSWVIPTPINLEQSYIIFPLHNTYSVERDTEFDPKAFLSKYAEEMSEQLPGIHFAAPKMALDILSFDPKPIV